MPTKAKPASLFASRLRQFRTAAGLSVAELATSAGLSRQTLWELERGDYQPKWETVCQLADALGIQVQLFREKA